MTLNEYLSHTDCFDCPLAKWEYSDCKCPLLGKTFSDDGKIRTTKRSDCPIKKYRKKTRTRNERD